MIEEARDRARWLRDNPGSLAPDDTYDPINAAILAAECIEALAAAVERLQDEVLMVRSDQDMAVALACAELRGLMERHKQNEIQLAMERNGARAELAKLKALVKEADALGVAPRYVDHR